MIKRGLISFLIVILFSTIVSALTSQDYYSFFNVTDFTGIIVKLILFIILAVLVNRGLSSTIFRDNLTPSIILSILISFLMVKSFSTSITEILVGIAFLLILFLIIWLITRSLTGQRATPQRRLFTGVIVSIAILVLLFIFLRISEYLGYKGIFDFPLFYTINNYLRYLLQAEIFFNIAQFFSGFRIRGYSLLLTVILFILAVFLFYGYYLLVRAITHRRTGFFLFFCIVIDIILFFIAVWLFILFQGLIASIAWLY